MTLWDGIFGAGYDESPAGLAASAMNAQPTQWLTASAMNAQRDDLNMQQDSAQRYALDMLQRQQQDSVQGPQASGALDPNEDPAYATPLSTLKGMWEVKWGDAWIQTSTLRKAGAFWDSAKERLWSAGLLERTDGRNYWYRIKE